MSGELSPYLLGPYAPIERELDAEISPVMGEVPGDLAGVFVRNGPNPRFAPKGRYHWFDGDGMLHAVELRDGRAHYRNRWVRTDALAREIEAGGPLWSGVMESVRDNPKDAPFKDTANTDVVYAGGKLWALWYLSGVPRGVDVRSLESIGPIALGGAQRKMSAHAKVEPKSGEVSFFDFGFVAPFMSYGVASADGGAVHVQPIDLPGPRLPHDLAITPSWAVVMDLPIVYDAAALAKNRWVTRFDPSLPARFGVLPRKGGDVRWFEAEPCYIYHVINAWEEDGAVVMIACRVADPIPRPKAEDGAWAQMLANLRVTATLHRWRFDLRTGRTQEDRVDDLNTEFPGIAAAYRGQKSRYSYHAHLPDTRTLVFDGLVKYDLETGGRTMLELGAGRFGSEPTFAPRIGAKREDDGYVLSFVHDDREQKTELWIMDATALERGPITKLALPQRVPLGFHGCFVSAEQLGGTHG